MNDTAIVVKKISKRYRIGKQQSGRYRYISLRDSLADAAQNTLARLRGEKAADGGVNEIWALKDVSFEVKKGEAVGIIGRNGAGKSTLLKVLSRITRPTSGRVELHGRVGSLLEVGTGFHPELTGRENIYLNGAVLGMRRSEIEHKFDEIVAFSEIAKFLDTPVKHYSTGMYTRLAFSVAAHLEPEILVVDEVLAVGDMAFQKKCLGKMGEVANQGRTVLFVSHNMTAISALCSRSILLNQGKIEIVGQTEDVIAEYFLKSTGGLTDFSNGYCDVSDRPRRKGEKPIACDIQLLDANHNPVEKIGLGDALIIKIGVRGLSRIRDAQVGVNFVSGNGQRLATLSTFMVGVTLPATRQEDEVAILTIPAYPFMPGVYSVNINITQEGIEWIDFVEDAIRFEVYEKDVYQNGYRITDIFGVSLLNGEWEIKPKPHSSSFNL